MVVSLLGERVLSQFHETALSLSREMVLSTFDERAISVFPEMTPMPPGGRSHLRDGRARSVASDEARCQVGGYCPAWPGTGTVKIRSPVPMFPAASFTRRTITWVP